MLKNWIISFIKLKKDEFLMEIIKTFDLLSPVVSPQAAHPEQCSVQVAVSNMMDVIPCVMDHFRNTFIHFSS